MKYYGNDPYVTGNMDGIFKNNPVAKAYVVRGKRVKMMGVKTIEFPSVSAAAEFIGVRQPTMTTWCKDGKEHQGAKWMKI